MHFKLKMFSQNIMTLDGEMMALNGRVLTGQMNVATSERNICQVHIVI